LSIKYSVAIPTYNGSKYLSSAINSILKSPRTDIEVLVSNNFSSDNTKEILKSFDDSRLNIVEPDVFLPMSAHYEFIISKARGQWLTIIGDDDAIMSDAFDKLDNLIYKYPDIEIITSARAYYFWEGCEKLYGNKVVSYSSKLSEKKKSTNIGLISSLFGLKSSFELPKIYTGSFIKKTLFEEIKSNSGGYFYHSINPDIYSSVAICLSRSNYLFVEEPLAWVGTSNKTMSNATKLDDENKNLKKSTIVFMDKIPKKISSKISFKLFFEKFHQLFIYESLVQCPLRKYNYDSKFIKTIIYSSVLATIIDEYFQRDNKKVNTLIKEIYSECKKNKIFLINLVMLFAIILIFRLIINIIKIIKILMKKSKIFGYFSFYSNDRNKFKNILDASNHIIKLKANIKKIIF